MPEQLPQSIEDETFWVPPSIAEGFAKVKSLFGFWIRDFSICFIHIFICSLQSDPNLRWVANKPVFWVVPVLVPCSCICWKMTKPHLGSLGPRSNEKNNSSCPAAVPTEDSRWIPACLFSRHLAAGADDMLMSESCHLHSSPFGDSKKPMLQVFQAQKLPWTKGYSICIAHDAHEFPSKFHLIKLKHEKPHPRNSGALPAHLTWLKLSWLMIGGDRYDM